LTTAVVSADSTALSTEDVTPLVSASTTAVVLADLTAFSTVDGIVRASASIGTVVEDFAARLRKARRSFSAFLASRCRSTVASPKLTGHLPRL
jgi:hypothetical protein